MNRLTLRISLFHESDYGPLFSELAQLGLTPEPVNVEDRLFFQSRASMSKLMKIMRILKKYSDIIRQAELLMMLDKDSEPFLRVAFIQLDKDDNLGRNGDGWWEFEEFFDVD